MKRILNIAAGLFVFTAGSVMFYKAAKYDVKGSNWLWGMVAFIIIGVARHFWAEAHE